MQKTMILFLLPLFLSACEEKKKGGTKTTDTSREQEDPSQKKNETETPEGTSREKDQDQDRDREKIDIETAKRIRREQEKAEKEAGKSLALTRVYRHPCGVYFFYPETWKLREGDGALMLLPPDLKTIQGKTGELLLVLGEDAQGATRPNDPEVVQYVSGLVQNSVSFLKREGGMKVERRKGKEIGILSWKGTDPKGTAYRGKMWISILNGFGVGLIAVSPAENFPQREAVLGEIFATLGFKKPTSDPRLFGRWKYEKVYMSGTFSAITIRYMVLNPNGTCLEGGKLSASMTHQDSDGNFTGGTSGNSAGGFRYRGRWRTQGKMIYMDWGDDGLEEWKYIISKGSLLLTSGKTSKLWAQIR